MLRFVTQELIAVNFSTGRIDQSALKDEAKSEFCVKYHTSLLATALCKLYSLNRIILESNKNRDQFVDGGQRIK